MGTAGMNRFLLQIELFLALLVVGGVPLLLSSFLDTHLAWQLVILAIMSVVGSRLLVESTRRSADGLLALAQAYGQRHFAERLPRKKWDALGNLGSAMHDMAQQLAQTEHELLRHARVESELSRFLRPELAAQIAAGQRPLLLNGQRCTVSVVFIDLVDFTAFAETASPTHVVALLQEVDSLVAELIFRHCGILDKSVGDCIMAVFGAPGTQHDHAQRALFAAEDMQRFVRATAPKWQRAYGFDVRLAIGISTGEAIVGNLGSETRLEYTAVGDVVGVAARLAALARPGQILLTTEVAAHTLRGFDFNSLGEQALFGQRAPQAVLELS